jgi:hypothetical protein
METIRYMRLRDRVETTSSAASGSVSLTGFQGVWLNTDANSNWIGRIELEVVGDHLRVRVRGAGEGRPDWGRVDAEAVYADGIHSARGAAFRASVQRGSMTVLLQGNLNLGLLVVAGFHLETGDSPKSNYFRREFFYNQAGIGG